MKRLSQTGCLVAALSVFTSPLVASPVVQSSPAPAAASEAAVLGQWRGLMESTPAIDLTIRRAEGSWAGMVVFYRIESDTDGNPKVVGQDEVPLQDIVWKAGVLSFGVRRGQATVRFTVRPMGSGSAELKRVGAPADEPPLALTRTSKAAR